ncbi:carbohydrate ABC transporter permease [Lacticaseibacillus manihotivorans]|uniref:Sugar ABC transporter permease n=2 Tax=Lacticaseibacillus manihotivorans TaxID=88233 RepID=A0A0R1R5H3_9LACO|nr:sugar ABC transporter permease [Lacticaseibacillus manihotivorans]KRL52621.1 sugar ABC transporter permease [Lacticaseibacillus manihotivorans DSM 13343 = JCM 12514]
MKAKKSRLQKSGWPFFTPSVIIISITVFIPMIQALITSFQSGPPTNMQFTGLANYQAMLHDATFKSAATNTFLYLIVQVPIMIFLALIISTLLNDHRLRFRGLFRTAIFLPCITSLVSYSLLMKTIFAPTGIVNKLLLDVHLIGARIQWLTDPFWAKVLIIFSITWRWTGYNMIFFLSGLQNISDEIYEAAEIDGSSKVHTFFHITIPMLKPIILFTTITSTIGTLQLFDEVNNITKGGPGNATTTLSQYIYNLSYKYTPNFGYAAAVSFVIVVAIVILTVIQMRLGRDDK